MRHTIIRPKTAVREEKRQANEALGGSFCKTLAELITNSDSSAKRKHGLPHSNGLIDSVFSKPVLETFEGFKHFAPCTREGGRGQV